jgi:hypothetical protein
MTMAPRLRKFALTAHVISSVGLLGAIACFLALAVAGLTSKNDQMVRAAYLAMDLIARFVILALAFASLLTGLIQSFGTPWGLFRHWWVLVKLLLTTFATIVLLMKMELIGYVAGVAAEKDIVEWRSPCGEDRTREPRRWRPHGVARAHDTLSVQAAGHDQVRVAKAVWAARAHPADPQ